MIALLGHFCAFLKRETFFKAAWAVAKNWLNLNLRLSRACTNPCTHNRVIMISGELFAFRRQ